MKRTTKRMHTGKRKYINRKSISRNSVGGDRDLFGNNGYFNSIGKTLSSATSIGNNITKGFSRMSGDFIELLNSPTFTNNDLRRTISPSDLMAAYLVIYGRMKGVWLPTLEESTETPTTRRENLSQLFDIENIKVTEFSTGIYLSKEKIVSNQLDGQLADTSGLPGSNDLLSPAYHICVAYNMLITHNPIPPDRNSGEFIIPNNPVSNTTVVFGVYLEGNDQNTIDIMDKLRGKVADDLLLIPFFNVNKVDLQYSDYVPINALINGVAADNAKQSLTETANVAIKIHLTNYMTGQYIRPTQLRPTTMRFLGKTISAAWYGVSTLSNKTQADTPQFKLIEYSYKSPPERLILLMMLMNYRELVETNIISNATSATIVGGNPPPPPRIIPRALSSQYNSPTIAPRINTYSNVKSTLVADNNSSSNGYSRGSLGKSIPLSSKLASEYLVLLKMAIVINKSNK
jgi:uncharacterized ubiquitin-like protein YukD